MCILYTFSLLISNAVTIRRDKSILRSRIVIISSVTLRAGMSQFAIATFGYFYCFREKENLVGNLLIKGGDSNHLSRFTWFCNGVFPYSIRRKAISQPSSLTGLNFYSTKVNPSEVGVFQEGDVLYSRIMVNKEIKEVVNNCKISARFIMSFIEPGRDYVVSLSNDKVGGKKFSFSHPISVEELSSLIYDRFLHTCMSDAFYPTYIVITLYLDRSGDKKNKITVSNVVKPESKSLNRTNILANVLQDLVRLKSKSLSDKETQTLTEQILWDNYQRLDNESYIKGLNLNLLDETLKNYILNMNSILINNCSNLIGFYGGNASLKGKEEVCRLIIKDIKTEYLVNVCLVYFIKIDAFYKTDENSYVYLVKIAKEVGNWLIGRYLYCLKKSSVDSTGEKVKDKFSVWRKNWITLNPELNEILNDDTFIVNLGVIIISILEKSNMIEKKIIKTGKDSEQYILILNDKSLRDRKEKAIINFPNKLPMIVKPKPFNYKDKGGYLLNDIVYSEEVIIDKGCYALNTEVDKDSNFYKMINNISCVPFKINVKLLSYIKNNNDKLGFLIDPSIPHKYHNLTKRSSYQDKIYKAYNSRIVLEQTILSIVEYYKDYKHIYFPVRSDQRGRLYCMSHYFNYQSNELSKALLLFANPGTVEKSDLVSINYLKLYGANLFGLSKKSNEEKINWVNDNEEAIINYSESTLVSEADEKVLFLAFCMEYRRLIECLNNESSLNFQTYLPIQLDGTCNGFQHLALLSNEKTLFKELNLTVDPKEGYPKDFYSFLLYKLIKTFELKLSKLSRLKEPGDEDKAKKESYKRLAGFNWERSHVKKAIMTITYNASELSMVKYIRSNLYKVNEGYCKPEDDWYLVSAEEKEHRVNIPDLFVSVSCIKEIILNDFEKIKKLTKYLKNIASLLNILELPIVWNLPHGLTIKQSYLKTKSTAIRPFMYSKTKINLRVTIKDKYDKNKQIRALMPNLIHSLDGGSLSLLATKFFNIYPKPSFYSVHDCFGTTMEKIDGLKTLLASVYTDLYSDDAYLEKFDKCVLDNIENNTPNLLDRNNRTVFLEGSKLKGNLYHILDIDWVKHSKYEPPKYLKKIDSQYLLI